MAAAREPVGLRATIAPGEKIGRTRPKNFKFRGTNAAD